MCSHRIKFLFEHCELPLRKKKLKFLQTLSCIAAYFFLMIFEFLFIGAPKSNKVSLHIFKILEINLSCPHSALMVFMSSPSFISSSLYCCCWSCRHVLKVINCSCCWLVDRPYRRLCSTVAIYLASFRYRNRLILVVASVEPEWKLHSGRALLDTEWTEQRPRTRMLSTILQSCRSLLWFKCTELRWSESDEYCSSCGRLLPNRFRSEQNTCLW